MNKANFTLKTNFPFTIKSADFLQSQNIILQSLTALGGANFVLSGCEEVDNIVSAGVIVIAGEILPFAGGAKLDKITIEEVRETASAFGVDYPDAYVKRHAKFDDNGTLNWVDFNRIVSNETLWQRIKEIKGDPPGVSIGWKGFLEKIPDTHMLEDGRTLNIVDYPDLYENIGTQFGAVGTTQFKLPNSGGRFSVAYSGQGDYDAIGKIGGEEWVTLLESQLPKHDHTDGDGVFNKLSAKAGDLTGGLTITSTDANSTSTEYHVAGMSDALWNKAVIKEVGENEKHENRPPFIVEGKIIKVKY